MAFIPYLIGLLAAGVAIALLNLGATTYSVTRTPVCIVAPSAETTPAPAVLSK